jgi:chemotaxis-related protein WspB
MQYIQLFLDEYRYIISTEDVVEITPWVKLTHVPKVPDYIAGLCSYRGISVPVIDLCELFLGRGAKKKLSTRIIFLDIACTNNNNKVIGILVEKATEIISVDEGTFMNPGIYGSDMPFVGPVVADEHGLVTKIMPKEIFSKVDNELLFEQA